MRKIFTKHPHTYFIIMYFLVQKISLFVHHTYIYSIYELLFVIYLFLSIRFLIKNKQVKSLVLQSGIIHLLLTIFYLPMLFWVQKVELGNPLAWLVLYPMGHFLLSIIIWMLTKLLIRLKTKKIV
jgi:hypothetical protein